MLNNKPNNSADQEKTVELIEETDHAGHENFQNNVTESKSRRRTISNSTSTGRKKSFSNAISKLRDFNKKNSSKSNKVNNPNQSDIYFHELNETSVVEGEDDEKTEEEDGDDDDDYVCVQTPAKGGLKNNADHINAKDSDKIEHVYTQNNFLTPDMSLPENILVTQTNLDDSEQHSFGHIGKRNNLHIDDDNIKGENRYINNIINFNNDDSKKTQEDHENLTAIPVDVENRGGSTSVYDLNTPEVDRIEYPEKGIFIIIGGFLSLFSVFGIYFIAGTIQSYIQDNQLKHESPSMISWIFAIYYCLFLCGTVLSGLYFDLNGFKKPAFVGAVLYSTGMLSLGNCAKVWHFILCFGVLTGLGSGILTSPILGVITHYFNKKRGKANAYAINGGALAGVLLPVMLQRLFEQIGYAWTMRTMGIICTVTLFIGISLMKEREEFRYNEPIDSPLWKFYLKESFDYKALFTDFKFLFCTLAITLCELGSALTLIYLSSYCVQVGHYSNSESFLIITVLNLMSIIGGYLNGYLADKFGIFNMMILTQIIMPLANMVIWYNFGYKSMTSLYVYSVIFGIEYGGLISLAPACCGQISKYDFGKKYSTMYFIVGLCFLPGIPIAGILIGDSSKRNYDNFIIYCSMMLFLSVIFFILSKMCAIIEINKYMDNKVKNKDKNNNKPIKHDILKETIFTIF